MLARIEEVGSFRCVRAPSADVAIRAVEALLAGGISIFEITMTVPGRESRDPVAGRAVQGDRGGRSGHGAVGRRSRARASTPAHSSSSARCSDSRTIEASHERERPRDARRAHADRSDHRVEGGRRHGEDLPLLGRGRREVPASAQGSPTADQNVTHGRREPRRCPNSSPPAPPRSASAPSLVDIKALAAGDDANLTERARELVPSSRSSPLALNHSSLGIRAPGLKRLGMTSDWQRGREGERRPLRFFGVAALAYGDAER